MPATRDPVADPVLGLAEIDDRLALALPEPHCELDHDDPWQLLVVTILSAQAKDAVINEIRPQLFARWPSPAALAAADQDELEAVIKRSGFFRNKAKAIRACAAAIVADHGGQVPRTVEALVGLPGVSFKTAHLVLGIGFGIASGIVVDTHVARVSERLGLLAGEAKPKPERIEQRLRELAPRERWIGLSHRLVLHGRHLCQARKPACSRCPIQELCPSSEAPAIGDWQTRAAAEGRLFAARGDRQRAGWEAEPA
jgi:endonuclease III